MLGRKLLGGLSAAAALATGSIGLAGGAEAAPSPQNIGTAFMIVSDSTNKCVTPISTLDNAPLEHHFCVNSTLQNWSLRSAGNGTFNVINLGSNACLDYATEVQNTQVKQHVCGPDINQRWRFMGNSTPDDYKIMSDNTAHGSFCLTLNTQEEGAAIVVRTCQNIRNQFWHLV
jgi:hypothetical protein